MKYLDIKSTFHHITAMIKLDSKQNTVKLGYNVPMYGPRKSDIMILYMDTEPSAKVGFSGWM